MLFIIKLVDKYKHEQNTTKRLFRNFHKLR